MNNDNNKPPFEQSLNVIYVGDAVTCFHTVG